MTDPVPIAHAIQLYLTDVEARGLSLKTLSRYDWDLTKLFLPYLSDELEIASLEALTPEAVRRFVADLRERRNANQVRVAEGSRRKLSPHTIAGHYRSVVTFLHWLFAEKMVASDLTENLRPPKVPRRVVNRLNEKEIAAVLKAMRGTWHPERNVALTLLMVDSGLRLGEVIALNHDDLHVDRNGAYVFIAHGKGDKPRFAPISIATLQALRAWLRVRPASHSERLFINHDGQEFTREAVRAIFRRIRGPLGLARLYPHQLRHSFANQYLINGGDLKSLSQILGHSKLTTTADIYLDLDLPDLQKKHHDAAPATHGRTIERVLKSNSRELTDKQVEIIQEALALLAAAKTQSGTDTPQEITETVTSLNEQSKSTHSRRNHERHS